MIMLIEELKKMIPSVEAFVPERGDAFLWIPAKHTNEACCLLRDRFGFDCLSCLSGTDRGDSLEVIYHLFSYGTKEALTLKVKVDKASAVIPTVAKLWDSAEWMERETFDLLGIVFEGHPDLRRIMLPEDWEGHPLRKDYQEPTEYAGMTTTRP